MDQKKCYKFQHELVDNLRVVYNTATCMIVFWNKYQIFLIADQELDTLRTNLPKYELICYTNFIVIHLIILENHLFCLDNAGNVFSLSLKLKQNAHKRSKNCFQPFESNVISMAWHEDFLFNIKLQENEWYLKVYHIDSESKLYIETKLVNKSFQYLQSKLNSEQSMLRCFVINKNEFNSVRELFNEKKNCDEDQLIIIMSFDKLTLYALLVNLKTDRKFLAPIKLLTCPSEINNVDIIKEDFLIVMISLSGGSIIKLPLNNSFKIPNTMHLNTAIHKFIAFKDKIMYTDGLTMWISTHIFSEYDVKLRQLFVKHVKDFVKTGDKIICTTYSKQIYIFSLKDDSSYLDTITDSEYSPAEHLYKNIHYLNRIIEEVEKNDATIKDIKREESYITTLALANREDIMNDTIQYIVNVYENYEDILKEDLILNLANNPNEHLAVELFYLLIKIFTTTYLQQTSDDVLLDIFTDSIIYITILSEEKIVKTVSIKILTQLKTLNIVVPLSMKNCNLTDINVNIKIVQKVPKVIDGNLPLLTVLHCKQVALSPEYFIKTDTSKNIRLLKVPEDPIENILTSIAYKHHGHLFRMIKASEDSYKWLFYVKLPCNYKELLQNKSYYMQHFNPKTAKFMLKEISLEKFLNSRGGISFDFANEKIYIEIIKDSFSHLSNNLIKVTCANPLLGLGIKNFFSNLAHNNFLRYGPGQDFLNCAIFLTLEQTEKEIKKCIEERLPFEEFFKYYEQFQKKICATLV